MTRVGRHVRVAYVEDSRAERLVPEFTVRRLMPETGEAPQKPSEDNAHAQAALATVAGSAPGGVLRRPDRLQARARHGPP